MPIPIFILKHSQVSFLPGIYQTPPPGVPVPFPGLFALSFLYDKTFSQVLIDGFPACTAKGKIPLSIGDQPLVGLVANGQKSKEVKAVIGESTRVFLGGKAAQLHTAYMWMANEIMPGSIPTPPQTKVTVREM